MLAVAESTRKSISIDLVIHDFDQWSNTRDAGIAFPTITWFDPEFEPRAVE